MIIIAEGARNVGKSYLLNSIKGEITTYKYPFADWFNNIFVDLNKNSEDSLFYMPFGMETAVLDLSEKNIIDKPILVDRSFLSNAVFGIMTNRITKKQAIDNLQWVLKRWPNAYHIVYIDANIRDDDRNKDQWSIYDPIKTRMLYEELLNQLNFNVTYFKNDFDLQSVHRFHQTINNIINKNSSTV